MPSFVDEESESEDGNKSDSTVIVEKPSDDMPIVGYSSSGFACSGRFLSWGHREVILSEKLYNMYVATDHTLHQQDVEECDLESGKIAVGVWGVYQRVVPKTKKKDFGFIEETRVITHLGLYSRHLCITLCPVVSTMGRRAKYIKSLSVKVVLYDEELCGGHQKWLKLVKGCYFVRGCSFAAGCGNYTLRTIVVEGVYHERAGREVRLSAEDLIPQRFVNLFVEATTGSAIIW